VTNSINDGKSDLTLVGRLVGEAEEGKDVLLGEAGGDGPLPDDALLHLRGGALVGELQAEPHGVQAQHAVEGLAAREVQDGVGVFLNRVVLDVDAVVRRLFEAADPHVGNAGALVGRPRVREVVGQEANALQLSHQFPDEAVFEDAVLASNDDVDVAALLLPPPVGAANLDAIEVERGHHGFHDVADELEHARDLLARDFLLELLEVLEADLLVAVEQVSPAAQLLDGLDAQTVQLVGLARTHSPHLAELAPGDVLLLALQRLQLVDLASGQQLLDLLGNLVPNAPEVLHVLLRLDLPVEPADDCCGLHVGQLPAEVSLGSVDLHELGEFVGDEGVDGEAVLLLLLPHHQLLDVHLLPMPTLLLLFALLGLWAGSLVCLVGVFRQPNRDVRICFLLHLLLLRGLFLYFLGLELQLLNVDVERVLLEVECALGLQTVRHEAVADDLLEGQLALDLGKHVFQGDFGVDGHEVNVPADRLADELENSAAFRRDASREEVDLLGSELDVDDWEAEGEALEETAVRHHSLLPVRQIASFPGRTIHYLLFINEARRGVGFLRLLPPLQLPDGVNDHLFHYRKNCDVYNWHSDKIAYNPPNKDSRIQL
jgi:hypothetical protein